MSCRSPARTRPRRGYRWQGGWARRCAPSRLAPQIEVVAPGRWSWCRPSPAPAIWPLPRPRGSRRPMPPDPRSGRRRRSRTLGWSWPCGIGRGRQRHAARGEYGANQPQPPGAGIEQHMIDVGARGAAGHADLDGHVGTIDRADRRRRRPRVRHRRSRPRCSPWASAGRYWSPCPCCRRCTRTAGRGPGPRGDSLMRMRVLASPKLSEVPPPTFRPGSGRADTRARNRRACDRRTRPPGRTWRYAGNASAPDDVSAATAVVYVL